MKPNGDDFARNAPISCVTAFYGTTPIEHHIDDAFGYREKTNHRDRPLHCSARRDRVTRPMTIVFGDRRESTTIRRARSQTNGIC